MRLPAVLTVLSLCAPHSGLAQDPNPVVQAVRAGMTCNQNRYSQKLDCEYRVGKDLYFAIAGVGDDDAGISFFKVDWDGDYYAGIGLQHGCVVVQQGKRIQDEALLPEFAFVSPRTGKIYGTWQQCASAR
jgi:hypothetical protein